MPATARPSNITTNVVAKSIALSLPVPMYTGNINLTCSFEAQPSGTLEYIGLLEQDLATLEGEYKIGRKLTIDGIYFSVTSYAYTRDRGWYKSRAFDTYTVTVGLGGAHERALRGIVNIQSLKDRRGKVSLSMIANKANVPYSGPQVYYYPSEAEVGLESAIQDNARRMKGFVDFCGYGIAIQPLSSGRGWSFGAKEILTDGENRIGELPYIKKAILTDSWSRLGEDPDGKKAEFERDDVERDELEEFDRKDYNKPPADTKVLRTLDSNFDKGGPKAVRKITYMENGQRTLEKTWVYGFMYTAEDIHQGNGVLFSDEPERYWKVVEYTEEAASFVKVASPVISIQAFDDQGERCKVILHPDYKQFASGNGNSITVKTTAEFIEAQTTTGFRWARLKTEEEMETLEPDDPYYSTYKFKKIPKMGSTAWRMKPTRVDYGSIDKADDSFGHPFRVEFMEVNTLPPALLALTGYSDTFLEGNPEQVVAVVYPDMNYVEPHYVETESSFSSSFHAEADPESTEDSPLPPLVTGSETYDWTHYIPYSNKVKGGKITWDKKVKADHHKKLVSNYSSQDAGFLRTALIVKSQEVAGQPPAPSSRNRGWNQKEQNQSQSIPAYYEVTSSLARSNYPANKGSVSAANAVSLSEAKGGIEAQLRIDAMNAIQSSRSVCWWVSGIRPGDRVHCEKDRFAGRFFGGTWRVSSVSWSMEVIGKTSYTGDRPMQITAGTSLNLGMDVRQSLSVRKKGGDDNPNDDDDNKGQRFEAQYHYPYQAMGSVIQPDVVGRRSFNV